MPKIIGVAGKGGTGKTTFAALAIRYLVEKGRGSILAVDADPNANLGEALGVSFSRTISDILEDTRNPKTIPEGMPKDIFVEYQLRQALAETQVVDLLVMGGPQGSGCYCYANDLLKNYLERMAAGYDFLVIDSEAGLEHLSRRTVPRMDTLFVISDATARGVRSAGRVHQIVRSLKTPVKELQLVVTRTTHGVAELEEEIRATELPLAGMVPLDPWVMNYDQAGKPIYSLPPNAVAVHAVAAVLEKSGL